MDGVEDDDDTAGSVATDVRDQPFDPSTIRDPLPQPLFSWHRLAIVAALAVAAACLVVAGRSAGDTDGGTGTDAAIESYVPRPGGRVLRQSQIGVTLAEGYDGRITIDGVAIPEEQMVGAIDPSSPDDGDLPPEQRDLGPRPNNKNVVQFQPGPGKAITEYDTGSLQVTIRYWRIADGPGTATTTTFTVSVF